MSAYIVNNETIHAIVKGFERYGVMYKAEDYKAPTGLLIDMQELFDGIGQTLLNQNYWSVNCRYGEKKEAPKYKYEDVEINEGILYGCITCYEYQACETNDYYQSDLHYSLERLKQAMIESMINAKGQKIPWGYENIE